MDRLLLALSTLCFLGGFIYAVTALRHGRHHSSAANMAVIGAGFVLQCAVLYLRGQIQGRCPITNLPEILVFVSWSMVLLYFVLGRAFRLSLLGVFTSPMVFFFQAIALVAFFGIEDPPAPATEVDPGLEFHAAMSLMAYGAFALACISGVMYLVQDRQLKQHTLKTLFHNLPPIQYLGQAIGRLLAIGLLMLTAGIVSAFFMKQKPEAHHLISSLIVWLAYAVLVTVQLLKKLGTRKVAGGAVAAFGVALMALIFETVLHMAGSTPGT